MKKGFTAIELLVLIAILGILIAIPFSTIKEHKKRDAFMSECRQDHKEYECQSMWGSANPTSQVVHVWSH